ncbi:MAG: hypothetical protein GWP91_24065 [Rhodobacterales bacterium]|nr:hypothetical protein [Rhodobacterales bacterium]
MHRSLASIVCAAVALAACGSPLVLLDSGQSPSVVGVQEAWEITDDGRLRVAIIGDFGTGDSSSYAVRDLVLGWQPDFIITMGDNNYAPMTPEYMEQNVGALYGAFMGPGDANRFLACTGNHDWVFGEGLSVYTDYFDLPGNERYYAVHTPEVDLFCLSSDYQEPDGNGPTSVQAQWLRDELEISTAPWQLVYLHHAPQSSGSHGGTKIMDWPFAAWGVDFVWSGHEHDYERLYLDGVLYGVQGLGGTSPRSMYTPQRHSRFGWTSRHAATLAQLGPDVATFTTVSSSQEVVDIARVERGVPVDAIRTLVSRHASWSVQTSEPMASWAQPGFDASTWPVLSAPVSNRRGDYGYVDWGNQGVRPITRWFRTVFDVPEGATATNLSLELVARDGAVVWLNGVQVAQEAMPAGPIDAATLATEFTPIDERDNVSVFHVEPNLLQSGENVLAVEVHLAGPNSPSGSLEARLRTDVSTPLLPQRSTWSYAVGVVANDWNTPNFIDATWMTGKAPLGYDSPLVATFIPGGTALDRPAVSRFRARFEVADVDAIDALLLEGLRGEGAVVWLNGVEVWRSNVGQREVEQDGFTPVSLPAGWAEISMETLIDKSALVNGSNVLAVQVHIGDIFQDTMVFDMGLRAMDRW